MKTVLHGGLVAMFAFHASLAMASTPVYTPTDASAETVAACAPEMRNHVVKVNIGQDGQSGNTAVIRNDSNGKQLTINVTNRPNIGAFVCRGV